MTSQFFLIYSFDKLSQTLESVIDEGKVRWVVRIASVKT